MNEAMHIGKQIKKVFDKMPRHCTISWFAGQIHCDRRNVYFILERPTIDTGLLHKISLALNHNFFLDLAESYDTEEPEEN